MILCQCSKKHVPLPMSYKYIVVDREVVPLCATTYYNVRELLTSFEVYATLPPGSVTKHYSKFVRELCFRIWKESQDQQAMIQ